MMQTLTAASGLDTEDEFEAEGIPNTSRRRAGPIDFVPTLLENTRAAGLGGECQAEVKSAPLMIPDPEVSDIPRRDFNLTSASVRVRKLITRRGIRRVV